jgi:hypothetical protein
MSTSWRKKIDQIVQSKLENAGFRVVNDHFMYALTMSEDVECVVQVTQSFRHSPVFSTDILTTVGVVHREVAALAEFLMSSQQLEFVYDRASYVCNYLRWTSAIVYVSLGYLRQQRAAAESSELLYDKNTKALHKLLDRFGGPGTRAYDKYSDFSAIANDVDRIVADLIALGIPFCEKYGSIESIISVLNLQPDERKYGANDLINHLAAAYILNGDFDSPEQLVDSTYNALVREGQRNLEPFERFRNRTKEEIRRRRLSH